MGYEVDINSFDNFVKIVKCFLLYLQFKWVNEVGNLILMGIEFIFLYLVKFFEGKVMFVNMMYGEIVGLVLDLDGFV